MLDKSIPYKHVLMKRPRGTALKPHPLPDGFVFAMYKDGDERDWAEIEVSVQEFPDEERALAYWEKEFLPYPEELKRRQVFVRERDSGKAAATITAWWKMTGERRDAVIHWVAVKPEYQGRGLGKAIVSEGIRLLAALEGDVNMYLHTQTWSYKAINIYKNEYEEAMKIIGDRIRRS